MASSNTDKQNVTISISRETVRKARILAARHSTSISGLLADEIEKLVGIEDAWSAPNARPSLCWNMGFV